MADAVPPPTGAEIAATHPDFVDVSHHQGEVDWKAYKAAGNTGAVCKVTEGGDFVDDHAATNRAGMKEACLDRGLYHFARPKGDVADLASEAKLEANNYLAQVGKMDSQEFPILDLEGLRSLKYDKEQLTSWASSWMETVQTATGKTPWLYSGVKDLVKLDAAQLSKYPLWVADYRTCDRKSPPDVGDFSKNLVAWQYTESYTGFTGIPPVDGKPAKVDGSYLYGNFPVSP